MAVGLVKKCLVFLGIFLTSTQLTYGNSVVQLNSNNLDSILEHNQLVFINFYADWCRFSRMLAPIFEEASKLVGREYPVQGKVVLAKVDCDSQPDIAQKYHVNKYPTMKLIRGGQLVKREYRGQRSAEGLLGFIKEQMKDPVTEFKSLDEVYELPRDKRTIIGYFTNKESAEFDNFEKVANALKDDCSFHAGFGEVSKPERTTGDNVIFKPIGENTPEMVYLGSLSNYNLLLAWSQDKCIPLVKEITFANGEELTEEGLPFLILFHVKEDTESLETYKKEVSRLVSFRSSVNFLMADCETFSHPLHHLGKSVRDCPLVAIDSFKHMYMFPRFEDITEPGKLKQFILDLHSGKLHREFHHGPDPVVSTNKSPPPTPKKPSGYHASQERRAVKKTDGIVLDANTGDILEVLEEDSSKDDKGSEVRTERDSDENSDEGEVASPEEESTTIKSVFVKMKPSEHRYTILDKIRDEL